MNCLTSVSTITEIHGMDVDTGCEKSEQDRKRITDWQRKCDGWCKTSTVLCMAQPWRSNYQCPAVNIKWYEMPAFLSDVMETIHYYGSNSVHAFHSIWKRKMAMTSQQNNGWLVRWVRTKMAAKTNYSLNLVCWWPAYHRGVRPTRVVAAKGSVASGSWPCGLDHDDWQIVTQICDIRRSFFHHIVTNWTERR